MPILHETFDNKAAADRAVDDLLAAGISPDDISVLVSVATKDLVFPPSPDPLGGDIARGAAAGGLAACVGGFVLGGVFVAGALGAALAGGASGLTVGVLTGGLVGAGVAVSDADAIERHVAAGEIVVTVHATKENAADVDEIFRHNNRGIEPT